MVPRDVHDRYRRDKSGRPTFDTVMRGLHLLQEQAVDYNVLCVVHRHNCGRPLDVYRFFKKEGVEFLQFIPLVEKLLAPGRFVSRAKVDRDISRATVPASGYGRFLATVYDEWVRHDVGRVYVQIFEAAFASILGRGPGLCLFEPRCGRAMALEHNGDLYSCDHFVFPDNLLGNILAEPLEMLVEKPLQVRFGDDKQDTLPDTCGECPVLVLCRGECPKNRFLLAKGGQPGLNYLCEGLKMFFGHATPTLEWMAQALLAGRAPAEIMSVLRDTN
jgi:uncharacterized protein